jgi:hypothetical protein
MAFASFDDKVVVGVPEPLDLLARDVAIFEVLQAVYELPAQLRKVDGRVVPQLDRLRPF